jgi:hypothetical protein
MKRTNVLLERLFSGVSKQRLLILLGMGLLTAVSPQTGHAKEVLLDCYSSEMNTDIYRFYFAAQTILQRSNSWVKLSSIESPGTQYNIEFLGKLDETKKSHTIINTSDTGYWLGRDGKRPYTKKHAGLRVLGGFNVVSSIWVTINPDIKKLPEDLIGKRIGLFPEKFAQAPYWDILIDKVWKIRDKAKYTRIFFNPGCDALFRRLRAVCSVPGSQVENPSER